MVDLSLVQIIQTVAKRLDDLLRNFLEDALNGKTVTDVLRENSDTLMVVLGIPIATSALTLMGAGPLVVGAAAWAVPAVAVALNPDLLP